MSLNRENYMKQTGLTFHIHKKIMIKHYTKARKNNARIHNFCTADTLYTAF